MRLLVLALFLGCAGCSSVNNGVCSTEARAGVNVSLRDAATNEPVCDAKVVISDDSSGFSEEPIASADCIYAGAFEREGNYRVTVTHPSYALVVRDGIVVANGDDPCHITAQTLAIELSAP